MADWDSKVIQVRRVTRVTSGGKRFKVRVVLIAGNRQGEVGIGIGKGNDMASAVEKAKRNAQKNKIVVPLSEGALPHEVEGRVGAGRVLIRPAKRGRGLIVGGPVRLVLSFAGVRDSTAKILGRTKNPLINTLAAFEGLKQLKISSTHGGALVRVKTSPPLERSEDSRSEM